MLKVTPHGGANTRQAADEHGANFQQLLSSWLTYWSCLDEEFPHNLFAGLQVDIAHIAGGILVPVCRMDAKKVCASTGRNAPPCSSCRSHRSHLIF